MQTKSQGTHPGAWRKHQKHSALSIFIRVWRNISANICNINGLDIPVLPVLPFQPSMLECRCELLEVPKPKKNWVPDFPDAKLFNHRGDQPSARCLHLQLVGGWTAHLKNMLVKLDHFHKVQGANPKNVWNDLGNYLANSWSFIFVGDDQIYDPFNWRSSFFAITFVGIMGGHG